MRKIDNCLGKKYNKLTIVSDTFFRHHGGKYKRPFVYVHCECGGLKLCDAYHVLNGRIISCGCIWGGQTTHGLSKHRLYAVWEGIKARCYNPNYNQYCDYGGRGIKMCDDWRDDAGSFIKWSLSNGWQKGLTIERVNNDGNYEPGNCKFVTWAEQCKNKRNTRRYTINGKSLMIKEWAAELGISVNTIQNRLYTEKWDIERAFLTPAVKGRNQYNKL